MESIPPTVLKKLWNMTRLMLFSLKKGVSKTKLMLDLHLMIQHGKVARKALSNLLSPHHHHHHSAFFRCGSSSTSTLPSRDAHVPPLYPGEYEFSCSSTPVWQPSYPFRLRKRGGVHRDVPSIDEDDVEMLDFLGGGGRQLRITDSPFPEMDGNENGHVDREAEEFIARFYENLRLQKSMSGSETPYNN